MEAVVLLGLLILAVGGAALYVFHTADDRAELKRKDTQLDGERDARAHIEEAAAEERARRDEEFNAKADAVADVADAVRLLREASARLRASTKVRD